MIGMRIFLNLLCSILFFTPSTFSAPGTPSQATKSDSSGLYEASQERSLPAEIDERAVYVSPPRSAVNTIVRYVAIYYDLNGRVRILLPSYINEQMLGLASGAIQHLAESLLFNFNTNPDFTRLPNWGLTQPVISFPGETGFLTNQVVNLCIDFNVLPILQGYTPGFSATNTPQMDAAMVTLIRNAIYPYWIQAPSAHLIRADPRGVNAEWLRVPDVRWVGTAITYVFNYLTPPGTPYLKTVTSAQLNVTLAGNFTQVATKLELTNSTVHVDAKLTKRVTATCRDFYPNPLSFFQGGPITEVGTNTVSCAS